MSPSRTKKTRGATNNAHCRESLSPRDECPTWRQRRSVLTLATSCCSSGGHGEKREHMLRATIVACNEIERKVPAAVRLVMAAAMLRGRDHGRTVPATAVEPHGDASERHRDETNNADCRDSRSRIEECPTWTQRQPILRLTTSV